MTPALSSQQRKVPSGLCHARLCLIMTAGWTFFLSFWTPFLTEQRTTSPMDPAGNLLRWPLTPWQAMMYRFLAPELSAQLRVAATGRPLVILSLIPTAPVLLFLAIVLIQQQIIFSLNPQISSQWRSKFSRPISHLYDFDLQQFINIMNNSLFLENNLSQFIIRYNEGQPEKIHRSTKSKPISVSSEISLPTRYKKKLRVNSSQISSFQKKEKRSPSHSLHTNADDKKQQRDYSRVPIEYMEERDSGNPADRVRGRVVYRGYAPKNTYFYFKTIKELRFAELTGRGDRDYRGEDICFNSKFESGNLNAAVRVGSRQYWLYMREDTNTHGLRQWFFFEVRSRKSIKIKMRIYRFTKKFSLYKLGMKPYVRTFETQWRQSGQNIVYQYDSSQKCYYLEFEYQFEEHKEVYFASLPPYTYSMMNSYLEGVATDCRVAVKKEGLSLGGLDIFSLKITAKRQEQQHSLTDRTLKEHQHLRQSEHSRTKKHEKQAIVVLARTHPGETVSNWSLQSFIDRVLQKEDLTDHYNFYILPMVNPDGVFLGNHRTGVLGQDLNRNFNNYDLQYFPQVQIVENFISRILKRQKIAFLFDLHGHSAKKNIFAFGEECDIGTNRYLYSRIIPKIIADTIDSFKLDFCLFKASKEKSNTARVYFSRKYNLNAITFQQSYGLLESGCIGISNWRNFGTALADSLLTYAELVKEKKDENIFYYLSDLMDAEKEETARKVQKQQERERKLKEKEKQREKQRQRQRQIEQERQKVFVSKTQETEGFSSKISKIFDRYPRKSQTMEQPNAAQIEEEVEKENQSLSSGDEELQMRQNQLELIKKEIFRVGVVNKQIAKRELYSMAEKKMQLGYQYADYPNRLHHKNSAMVQRIFKFKSKQRGRQFQMPHSISERQRNNKIELPYIRK